MRDLAARLEILERISDLGLGLDLPDPIRYRRCFGDVVKVHNPTFDRIDSYSGDDWAASVSRTQNRLTTCLHTLTCPSVDVQGTRAEATLMQHAHFGDATGSFRVAGPLHLSFAEAADGWRIGRLDFQVRWSEGDPSVYRRARKAAQ